jgi:hypothetical protein
MVVAILVVTSAATFGASARPGDAPRPYDLGVRVVPTTASGASTTLADDLRAVLVDELAARTCYRSVRAVEDDRREPGQLVFKVRIDEVENLTEHDVSLARRELSDQPADRSRFRIEFRLVAEAGLLAPGSEAAILSKPYRVRIVERPRFVGHDPAPELRARLLDDFAERVADIACKPDSRRLDRWIREASPGSARSR